MKKIIPNNRSSRLIILFLSLSFAFVNGVWAQTISGITSMRVGQSTQLDSGSPSFPLPTGGTISTVGNDRIHVFSGNSTFNLSQNPIYNAKVLIVGGGGGGGFNGGGGGGAGAYIFNTNQTINPGAYPITVGAGGNGSLVSSATGANGGDSSFNGVTAIGGGGGATRNLTTPALDGGSGGGGGGGSVSNPSCTYSVRISAYLTLTEAVIKVDGVTVATLNGDPDYSTSPTVNFNIRSGQVISATLLEDQTTGVFIYGGPNGTGGTLFNFALSPSTPSKSVNSPCSVGGAIYPGFGISGQGNNGGAGIQYGSGCLLGAGGGGGGAGGLGTSASSGVDGVGGLGILNDITGINQWYAGGGGGGFYVNPSCGVANPAGALGGSGVGGIGGTSNGVNGTGSGGGAERNGGSGIVIIRYPLPTWTSSNPSVAVVNQSGIVEAIAPGTTTISHTYNGTTISTTFTVTAPPTITITGDTQIFVGGTSDLDNGLPEFVPPTGGEIVTAGNERTHTFYSSGTFSATQPIYGARTLAVGGGGGGGANGGGGGGAGAYIHTTGTDIISGNHPVIIGAGGLAASNSYFLGGNGGNTTFFNAVALGGGGGGSREATEIAARGGSGGGGCANGYFIGSGGESVLGYGSYGGDGTNYFANCYAAGGGGGGAGGSGGNASNGVAGVGGAGVQNNISGSNRWYAAGGGGGLTGNPTCGLPSPGGALGGSGIGGNGESTNGSPNTGSGGGAERDGGSGILIIRYYLPKWSSSNTSIATVNPDTGVVTGVAVGSATISYNLNATLVASTTVVVSQLTITGATQVCVGATNDFDSGEPNFVAPTGGNITTVGTDRVHKFTTSGTFNSTFPITNARVLAIGGGGGGGSNGGGGGGAGGFKEVTGFSIPSGSQSVVLGAGGSGSVSSSQVGSNGTQTSFLSIAVAGGGGGATREAYLPAPNGASGGGGSASSNNVGQAGGNGIAGQGYNGGSSSAFDIKCNGGGGGGAAAAGQDATSSKSGDGGAGALSNISGIPTYYCGGGGGGRGTTSCSTGVSGGNGGVGFGGAGGVTGLDGEPNTGAGGGGGRLSGASGGSGVVFIRYTFPLWSSSNTAVATVNPVTGVVSGVSGGNATITYRSFDGIIATKSITVVANATPVFSPMGPYNQGTTFSLPTVSNNGVAGSWSPAPNVNQTTVYTFTPNIGQCALQTTMSVTILKVPDFPTSLSICQGQSFSLPTTSGNGINGSWSPSIPDTTVSRVYTFTPFTGQDAATVQMSVTVVANTTPVFSQIGPICQGTSFSLPTQSLNGITGVWSPAPNLNQTTTYTFVSVTPCTNTAQMTVTIMPLVSPQFTQRPAVCKGSVMQPLPTTSINGITGTWSPAPNTNTQTVYTFTPDLNQCATTAQMTIAIGGNTNWNGTFWDNGEPDDTMTVTVSGDLEVNSYMHACQLQVQNNADMTVTSGNDLYVVVKVTVDPGATLTMESNANLLQDSQATTNSNTGNSISKRNTTMRRLDYTYWGSPVAGQNLQDFSPLTLSNRFYTCDEASNSFTLVDPLSNDFVTAKGYLVRAPNTFQNAPSAPQPFAGTFTGVPNNGNYSIPVTNTPVTGFGYNLLSNPYPSPLNAAAFLAANPGTIYFWTHRVQGGGSSNYGIFNQFGGTAPAAGGEAPNGFIQTGQGFMFHATASGNVNFTNAMRNGNNLDQFFRSANTTEKHRIWLNLYQDDVAMNQILVGYTDGATQGFDVSLDGKLIESGNSISSSIGDEVYGIQARALPFSAEDVVPLNFKALTAGSYSIAIDHVDGLFADTDGSGQDIYIKDNLTGTVQSIKQNAYTFASAEGTFADRFEIVYQNSPLGVEHPTIDSNAIVVYKKDGVLHLNSGAVTMADVKLFDMRGRLIYERSSINANTASLHDLRAEQQVLLVQIVSDEGKTVTKKVVY